MLFNGFSKLLDVVLHVNLLSFHLVNSHGWVSCDVVPCSALGLQVSETLNVLLKHAIQLHVILFANSLDNLLMLDKQVNCSL